MVLDDPMKGLFNSQKVTTRRLRTEGLEYLKTQKLY